MRAMWPKCSAMASSPCSVRRLPMKIIPSGHSMLPCAYAQGSIECPLGMIFMGNRRTEQGEDAIAEHLGHIALIAMHGVHHQLQCWVDNCSRFFGVEAFDQRRGA